MATSSTSRASTSRSKASTNGAAPADEHAKAAQESMTDQLAEEAKPVEMPEGAPTMTPYLKLPYRKRGQFMEKMAKVQEIAPKQKTGKTSARKSDGSIDLGEISGYYYLLAELDELLHLVAEDPAELEKWQASHDDSEFVELYNVYMRWSQAGEASSSAS